jgi:transcriptional regulator with XRE-family HTH domain
LGFSQRELEAMSGVSQAAISRYEKYEADIGGDSIVKLCKVFNCSADYLLGMTDDPRPYRDIAELSEAERRLLSAWHAGDLKSVLRVLAEEESK